MVIRGDDLIFFSRRSGTSYQQRYYEAYRMKVAETSSYIKSYQTITPQSNECNP